MSEPTDVQMLEYRGVTAWGSGGTGRTQSTPAHLTESLFKRRYREATVTDVSGRLVGAVCKDIDGKRTWWAEAAAAVEGRK